MEYIVHQKEVTVMRWRFDVTEGIFEVESISALWEFVSQMVNGLDEHRHVKVTFLSISL